MTKPVIIGAGLAGLSVALALAPQPVVLLSAHKLGLESSSAWAQGGIAAALGPDDSVELHAQDTMNAGAGLCNSDIVNQVTQDGLAVITRLVEQAVPFDRNTAHQLQLALEGAHSRRRIVHVAGDNTGAAIMQALIAAVQNTPSIDLIEDACATHLFVGDGHIHGVEFQHNNVVHSLPSTKVALATGGAGALWSHTTNPTGSFGHGLALAARAGAMMSDLEFMQFHPTAIDVGLDPMPLASEALRGEGALLIDEAGTRIMADYPRQELEPRDVVSRVIWNHINQGHRVFLDVRPLGQSFTSHFVTASQTCLNAGLNTEQHPIPVAPAAHYHMGGVATNAEGRSTIPGLWACGEVASTGLHGANRLASNSLLEAASFGYRVALDIKNSLTPHNFTQPKTFLTPKPVNTTNLWASDTKIRNIMSQHVGVMRHEIGLLEAIRTLTPLAPYYDKALAALMISTAALRRHESRGAHTRNDYPTSSTSWAHHQNLVLSDILPETEMRHAIGE